LTINGRFIEGHEEHEENFFLEEAVTTQRRIRSMARTSGPMQDRNTCTVVGGTAMKSTAAWVLLVSLAGGTAVAQDATVTPLLSKDLSSAPGKELSMITVEYAPGGSDPIHTHHAQALVYVLEGSIVMQVRGGEPVTLTPGQTFYEGPDDVHVVGRNASQTAPAKFLVILVKDKGAPILVPTR
jgi:quercetin dioxygenase-like cupin family protein